MIKKLFSVGKIVTATYKKMFSEGTVFMKVMLVLALVGAATLIIPFLKLLSAVVVFYFIYKFARKSWGFKGKIKSKMKNYILQGEQK